MREDLLYKTNPSLYVKSDQDTESLVTYYNQVMSKIYQMFWKHWYILSLDKDLAKHIKTRPEIAL